MISLKRSKGQHTESWGPKRGRPVGARTPCMKGSRGLNLEFSGSRSQPPFVDSYRRPRAAPVQLGSKRSMRTWNEYENCSCHGNGQTWYSIWYLCGLMAEAELHDLTMCVCRKWFLWPWNVLSEERRHVLSSRHWRAAYTHVVLWSKFGVVSTVAVQQ